MNLLRRKPKAPVHIPRFGDLYTYDRRGSENERVILFVAVDNAVTIPPTTGWKGIDLMEPEAICDGSGWIGFGEYKWRYLGNILEELS